MLINKMSKGIYDLLVVRKIDRGILCVTRNQNCLIILIGNNKIYLIVVKS